MGAFSIWHWVIVLAVVMILFGGKGKISQLMGDIGKGLKAFKKGVSSEDASVNSLKDGQALEKDKSDLNSEQKH